MAEPITIQFSDHVGEYLDALQSQVELALEAVGFQAERNAVLYCPVDTGLLRNSITFALDGETPHTQYYHADKAKNGRGRLGFYKGQAQREGATKRAVIVGTNVEYAIFVELGTSNPKYKKQPFLQPAMKNHGADYKMIFEKYLTS